MNKKEKTLPKAAGENRESEKKRKRNNIIALIIIIPILVALLCVRITKTAGRLKGLLKSGIFFEADFLLICAAVILLTLIIYFIFRRREEDRRSLLKGALTAAVGTVMTALFIVMCFMYYL